MTAVLLPLKFFNMDVVGSLVYKGISSYFQHRIKYHTQHNSSYGLFVNVYVTKVLIWKFWQTTVDVVMYCAFFVSIKSPLARRILDF